MDPALRIFGVNIFLIFCNNKQAKRRTARFHHHIQTGLGQKPHSIRTQTNTILSLVGFPHHAHSELPVRDGLAQYLGFGGRLERLLEDGGKVLLLLLRGGLGILLVRDGGVQLGGIGEAAWAYIDVSSVPMLVPVLVRVAARIGRKRYGSDIISTPTSRSGDGGPERGRREGIDGTCVVRREDGQRGGCRREAGGGATEKHRVE